MIAKSNVEILQQQQLFALRSERQERPPERRRKMACLYNIFTNVSSKNTAN